jgi:Uma2 family endonuclease
MSAIAHFTWEQYDLMVRTGVFEPREQNHVEFIRGEIRQMSPIGSWHAMIVDRLTAWSFKCLPEGKAWIRVQSSLRLQEVKSEPQPDILWAQRRDYSTAHPTAADVLLLIEVADSSLADDTGEKAELYADAGIGDYWVVNLPEHSIEVRRDPAAGRYRSLQTFTGNDEVRPLTQPEVVLRPAMLWEPIQ